MADESVAAFPIQRSWKRQPAGHMGYSDDGPRCIPWAVIAPHERQAQMNHGGQTLAKLAQRGGLCASEAVAVLEDREWRPYAEAEQRLKELVNAYEAGNG